MGEPSLRVAVLSPHAVVADGLRTIIAAMSDHLELVDLDSSHPDPDVVLYDAVGLVHGDATDLDILLTKTTSRVLVVSRDLRPGLAAEALAAGADGHFALSAHREEILAAIQSAVTDWCPGDGGASPVVGSPDSPAGKDLVGAGSGLTQRETQVLALVGQGWSNTEIADHLYLSPNTVKTYIRLAYRKIGATNRTQAAAWAIAHGLSVSSTL